MSSISERMKLVILEKQFSIKQASEETDIPYRSLQNYLNGQLPGPDALVKFREAFDVDLNWLLTGEGEIHRQSTKANSQIDSKLQKQIVIQLKKSMPQLFKHIETHSALKIFSLIYNTVCHLDDTDMRHVVITQSVGLYLAGLQDDWTETALEAASKATTTDEQEGLKEFAESMQRGKDKILKKHGVNLPSTESGDTHVTQNIGGSNHEIAGRDINKGK
ncbi:helix-turn-helix transcriptional regulator [Shewanella sp. Isolate7]|uniref:helix-turn-helix domain-containing protein n=1 Tax=Shewanella sp. Isolate7 TaxID=2908528 RepID=UPI001EFE2070|nr:helix-turn-helix transcriptional regulator [Shewanella sp. Isolate7]MCG9722676.1 helix-turn-helix domain-containing protein [Shewanella sp. Isolate7]